MNIVRWWELFMCLCSQNDQPPLQTIQLSSAGEKRKPLSLYHTHTHTHTHKGEAGKKNWMTHNDGQREGLNYHRNWSDCSEKR